MDQDEYKASNCTSADICQSIYIPVIFFGIPCLICLIFALVDQSSNSIIKYSFNPKEQAVLCDGSKIILERSTKNIKVFEVSRDEIELSDEVRSFSTNMSGYLGKYDYAYRSFLLTENSTVTIEKLDNFSAYLYVFKGKENMKKYFSDYYYLSKYEVYTYWYNDIYTFTPSEFGDYYIALKYSSSSSSSSSTQYSVEYFVELTTYETRNLTRKCESELKCKLNKHKKKDFCIIMDYNVSESSEEGKIKIIPDDLQNEIIGLYCGFAGTLAIIIGLVTYIVVKVKRIKRKNQMNYQRLITDDRSQSYETKYDSSSLREF